MRLSPHTALQLDELTSLPILTRAFRCTLDNLFSHLEPAPLRPVSGFPTRPDEVLLSRLLLELRYLMALAT